jgi:magnesium-transporting ATPase (P-type)
MNPDSSDQTDNVVQLRPSPMATLFSKGLSYILSFIVCFIIVAILYVFIFKLAWDNSVVPIFSVKNITFWQSFALLIAARLLFPAYGF